MIFRYDAIVLSGGRARRMGGADKAALVVGGRTLGARVAEALGAAGRVIVVGPVPAEFPVTTIATEEAPPGGGPVAAVAAGVALATADQVAVVAIDMPFVSAEALETLATAQACTPVAVALAVDDAGRDQPLCAVWGTNLLRAVLDELGDPAGVPMHRLVGAADLVARMPGLAAAPWFDCDTPADLAEAERRAS